MAVVLPEGGGGAATAASNVQVMDLREGMRGSLVLSLQEDLRRYGFDPGPLDGVFGPKTKAAVEALQRKLGTAVTGTIDATTRTAIGADLRAGANSVLRQNAAAMQLPVPASAVPAPAPTAAAPQAQEQPFYTKPVFLVVLGVGILAIWWMGSSGGEYAVGTVDDLNSFVGGDGGGDDGDDDPPPRRKRARRKVSTLK